MNDGIILRTSPEFTALRKNLLQAIERLDGLLAELRPSIRSETYLTSEEVRMIFDLCPRSLQNYRDNRLIPYTTIGGTILYPQDAPAQFVVALQAADLLRMSLQIAAAASREIAAGNERQIPVPSVVICRIQLPLEPCGPFPQGRHLFRIPIIY